MVDEGADRGKAAVLAGHYQHIADMSYRLWEERNRRFLYLLAIVALAVLLTYDAQTFMQIILRVAANKFEIEIPNGVEASLPYVILHGLLLAFVFYFMTDVFRLTASIMSNTEYRKAVELDLRDVLKLTTTERSYSYETNYRSWNPGGLKSVVGWFYVLLVGAMLALFLTFRLTSDWPANGLTPPTLAIWKDWLRQHFLLIADIVIGGATMLMYFGYAYLSLSPGAFVKQTSDIDRNNSKKDPR